MQHVMELVCVYHLKLESRRANLRWKHSDSSTKKSKNLSAGMTMTMDTVLWDSKRITYMDFITNEETSMSHPQVNVCLYIADVCVRMVSLNNSQMRQSVTLTILIWYLSFILITEGIFRKAKNFTLKKKSLSCKQLAWESIWRFLWESHNNETSVLQLRGATLTRCREQILIMMQTRCIETNSCLYLNYPNRPNTIINTK